MIKNKCFFLTVMLVLILLFPFQNLLPNGSFSNLKPRALSLKVLQQKLQQYREPQSIPQNLKLFCGINRILGYVIDRRFRDILLIGEVDEGLPPLHLEDWVVALRNTWLKYTHLKGNTQYYTSPGCSIDPNPTVLAQLDQVGKQMSRENQSFQEIEDAVNRWEQICLSSQQVRVLGVPFDTRFAWVMVQADYDMKRIVDGSDEIEIFAFTSLMDMELQETKSDIRWGRIPRLSGATNRFWFSPGEVVYKKDNDILMIDTCNVKLLTEEEHVKAEGKVIGTGKANPNAAIFAADFSRNFTGIAKQRPIFRDLENLYRFVALAKAMKRKSPHQKVGLSLEYLLNHYPLQGKKVRQNLPGRFHVKRYEKQMHTNEGIQTQKLWLPSCGGVEMDIELDKSLFRKESGNQLEQFKEKVLKERTSDDQLYYDIHPKDTDGQVINILIKRKIRSTDDNPLDCTMGELYVNGEYFCKTLELPFKNAQKDKSSVPVGTREAKLRYSKSKGQWVIEMKSPIETYVYLEKDPFVPRKRIIREPVQIHSGNFPKDTKGCILVGEPGADPYQVYNSRETLKRLMEKYFGGSKNPDLNKNITVSIQIDYK